MKAGANSRDSDAGLQHAYRDSGERAVGSVTRHVRDLVLARRTVDVSMLDHLIVQLLTMTDC
jgi:hypothetical protein